MLGKIGTILKWIILLPVLIAVVLLAVANDQSVTIHLNPFDTEDPVLKLEPAVYQLAFVVFVIGALVGGAIVWSGQRKHRRRARRQSEEIALWQARANRPDPQRAEARQPQAAAFLPPPRRS